MISKTVRATATWLMLTLLSGAASVAVEMNKIGTVSTADRVLSNHAGIDMDHNGVSELIISLGNSIWEVYEAPSDDTFILVHVVDLSIPNVSSSVGPLDAGDADGDGLSDVLVTGQIGNEPIIAISESTSATMFPSELVWQIPRGGGAGGDSIADTDADGRQEIVRGGRQTPTSGNGIAVYENDGDNSYVQTYFQAFPEFHTSQQFMVADDLDGDGRDEMLLAGLTPKVVLVESVGDDSYQEIWSYDLFYTDGQGMNANVLLDAGDLDNDGRREFLVGGLKTIAQGGDPFIYVLLLFEAVDDNDFELVATFEPPPVSLDIELG